ncbi:MAG: preprotein translocase subunit SecE [Acidobacteria bacterium]|nr:preprotein translocase subunit SecE [Acidobacteriota bacterium]
MKKVSWSSKAELIGSTVVVIVTVFLLALVIFAVDNGVVYTLSNILKLW